LVSAETASATGAGARCPVLFQPDRAGRDPANCGTIPELGDDATLPFAHDVRARLTMAMSRSAIALARSGGDSVEHGQRHFA
jgi:hypothetical protein